LRYLAIDLGTVRTGIAVGDDVTHIVTPVDVLEVARLSSNTRLVDAIIKAIERHAPGAVVIGLPINMDGTEGPAAAAARAFGAALAQKTGLVVHYQDERLTSFAAEQQVAGTGRTRKEKRELIDALAAAHILRDFLAAQSGGAKRSNVPMDDNPSDDHG
jgi:putative Holliday junction resolvase